MMQHIDAALAAALSEIERQAPPELASAIHHAVFPGGARIRPRLCHAVARAAGSDCPPLVSAVATSLELLHCASLVHDDLPCFDAADTRRGLPSVHCAFGEPLAVLAGDALIVLAFECLARPTKPERLPALLAMIAESAGAARGLVAGQGWESEPQVPLVVYHQAKTGSLFVAATMGGALAAGHDPEPWRGLGDHLGEAYQVADDLLDACAEEAAGKPLGQDAQLGRPSAVAEHGVEGAVVKLRELVDQAAESVPNCAGAPPLRALVRQMAERLVPARLRQTAA